MVTVAGRIFTSKNGVSLFCRWVFLARLPEVFQSTEAEREILGLEDRENRERARSVGRILRRQGIRVMRILEHDVEARSKRLENVLNMLRTPA
jgi:hypothetical protein